MGSALARCVAEDPSPWKGRSCAYSWDQSTLRDHSNAEPFEWSLLDEISTIGAVKSQQFGAARNQGPRTRRRSQRRIAPRADITMCKDAANAGKTRSGVALSAERAKSGAAR